MWVLKPNEAMLREMRIENLKREIAWWTDLAYMSFKLGPHFVDFALNEWEHVARYRAELAQLEGEV